MARRSHKLLGGGLAALVIISVVAAGVTAALAKPMTYALPTETSKLKLTSDRGYAMTEAICAVCHSRDYMTTQPSGKGLAFWTAEVNKMVTVYGAPIAEADRGPIAEYLAAAY